MPKLITFINIYIKNDRVIVIISNKKYLKIRVYLRQLEHGHTNRSHKYFLDLFENIKNYCKYNNLIENFF